MKYLIVNSPFVFAFFYGLFSALMDARKDYGFTTYSKLWDYYIGKGTEYEAWYYGNNPKYPSGNPFKCDFWHWSKHVTSWLIVAMVMSSMLSVLLYPSIWRLSYLLLSGTEGITFTFFYSYALRNDRSFSWYVKHLFTIGWKPQ